jgi:hypothetical protein
MKVLDLHCARNHTFEGWFGSEADFQSQLVRGLVECPLCADKTITKMLSAPRLNLGATQPASEVAAEQPAAASSSTVPVSDAATPAQDGAMPPLTDLTTSLLSERNTELQAAWLKMVRHVVANTEDVGNQFAEEARKIHYGEAKERGIRGQATRDETEALLEEGIAILPVTLPSGLTGPLQ